MKQDMDLLVLKQERALRTEIVERLNLGHPIKTNNDGDDDEC